MRECRGKCVRALLLACSRACARSRPLPSLSSLSLPLSLPPSLTLSLSLSLSLSLARARARCHSTTPLASSLALYSHAPAQGKAWCQRNLPEKYGCFPERALNDYIRKNLPGYNPPPLTTPLSLPLLLSPSPFPFPFRPPLSPPPLPFPRLPSSTAHTPLTLQSDIPAMLHPLSYNRHTTLHLSSSSSARGREEGGFLLPLHLTHYAQPASSHP